MNRLIIIIPSYNPNEELVKLVENLDKQEFNQILIINDGSKQENSKYFEKVKDKALILKNSKNKGKGNSLKRAMKWILENKKEILGIITVDADGQHSIKDIDRIKKRLILNKKNNDEKLILGRRDFKQKNIPFRSKVGNIINSYLMQIFKKAKIKDTQTGLRGIPAKYLEELSKLEGENYEYEQNMLFHVIDKGIPFEEIGIETIYNKNNESNYKISKDTYKILKTYLKNKKNRRRKIKLNKIN